MSANVQLVSQLHNEAMEYTDESFIARGLNERDEYLRLTKLAYEKEAEAANLLFDEDVEPTRSILHRSAATLAFRCDMYPEAKRLIHRALSGHPPADIEIELNDLLGKVKLAVAGIDLTENQVQLALEGGDIAFGKAPTPSVISRIQNIKSLIQISASFDYPVYFDAIGAGSFYVNLTVGKYKQPPLPGFDDNNDLIAPLIENLKLLHEGEFHILQRRIEDPDDFRRFVNAARNLAPDGKDISTVNVQAKIGSQVQSIVLTRSREDLRNLPIPGTPKRGIAYAPTASIVSRSGVLKVADSRTSSECLLVSQHSPPWTVEVREELMNSVLGRFFNKQVAVRGKQMKISRTVRRIRLETIADIRLEHG